MEHHREPRDGNARTEVLARGPNFVYGQEFVRSRYGDSMWQRILEKLPADSAEVWRQDPLVTGTYPFQAFKDMLGALERVAEVIPEEETSAMYEHIADRSLTGVHKFFLRFAEPSFVIKRYPLLWQRFFLAGRVTVPEATSGHAKLEFEVPSIFLDWLRPACTGYSRRAVELAGGSHCALVDLGHRELGDDLHLMSYELSWIE